MGFYPRHPGSLPFSQYPEGKGKHQLHMEYTKSTDILIVKYGDKYRLWNAAFDAGIAKALDKPIITLHEDNLNHALKEINQSAVASCRSVSQVVQILTYVIKGEL